MPRAIALIRVETQSADEVVASEARLAAAHLETSAVDDTQCCHAPEDRDLAERTDGARWEWYVKTGDSEQLANLVVTRTGGGCRPA